MRLSRFAAIVGAASIALVGGMGPAEASSDRASRIADMAGYAIALDGVTSASMSFKVPDLNLYCGTHPDEYGIAIGVGIPQAGAVQSLGGLMVRCIGPHFNPPFNCELLSFVGATDDTDSNAKAGDEITINFAVHESMLTITVINSRHQRMATATGPAPADGRLVFGSFPDVYRHVGIQLPVPEFGRIRYTTSS